MSDFRILFASPTQFPLRSYVAVRVHVRGHKVAQVEIAQMGPPWFPLVNVIRKFLSALIGHV